MESIMKKQVIRYLVVLLITLSVFVNNIPSAVAQAEANGDGEVVSEQLLHEDAAVGRKLLGCGSAMENCNESLGQKCCEPYVCDVSNSLGKSNMNGSGSIAWDNLCKSKKAGRIGFHDIAKWNQAAVAKHVWTIANKKDNLWVKWVHSVYIDQENWWEYKALAHSSWYWSKIINVKEAVKLILPPDQFTASDFKSTYVQDVKSRTKKFSC
uniref:Uncharacterized protein n=1 Tax=Cannabis sativa TaxID=3483 RepID=A0A803Q9Y6_CANSA